MRRKMKGRLFRRRKNKRRRNYSHWIPAYMNPRRRSRNKRRSKRRFKRNSYYTPRMAMNGRRRRRKHRKLNSRRRARFSYRSNRRSRRHKRRKHNYSHWIPAYRNNPRGIASALTAGLNPALIKAAYPIAVGAFSNEGLSNVVAGMSFVPSMMKSGAGRTVLSLMTAAGQGLAVGMGSGLAPKVIKREWAGPVFVGGVVQALVQATREMIWPAVKTAFGLSGFDNVELDPYLDYDMSQITSTPLSLAENDVIQRVSEIELAS